jgi:hypothetical protein
MAVTLAGGRWRGLGPLTSSRHRAVEKQELDFRLLEQFTIGFQFMERLFGPQAEVQSESER